MVNSSKIDLSLKDKSDSDKAPDQPIQPHILVVDDEEAVRRIISAILKREGYAIEGAADGLEGIQKFENSNFDLVVTDYSMPGMNGDKMAVVIKGLKPETPIVMISGTPFLAQEKGGLSGVDAILCKPVCRQELLAMVATLLRR